MKFAAAALLALSFAWYFHARAHHPERLRGEGREQEQAPDDTARVEERARAAEGNAEGQTP